MESKFKIECVLHKYIRDLPGMTIAHSYYKMGYASAISWVIFATIMVVTLLLFRYSSGKVYYSDAGDF